MKPNKFCFFYNILHFTFAVVTLDWSPFNPAKRVLCQVTYKHAVRDFLTLSGYYSFTQITEIFLSEYCTQLTGIYKIDCKQVAAVFPLHIVNKNNTRTFGLVSLFLLYYCYQKEELAVCFLN